MLLNNLIIADSGRKVNIRVSDGIIADVCLADNVGAAKNSPLDRVPPLALAVAQRGREGESDGRGVLTERKENTDDLQINFTDAIVFPGLINSHDHLDFNLFPQLGNRKYNNYTEWGEYIHKAHNDEIAAILQVPQALRSQWGMYKNLLCGVTTVVNHGSGSDITDKLITIFDDKHDLHSVGFDKQWKLRLNNPLKRKLPVVIHAGEGADAAAGNEIDVLIRGNKLRRKVIAVHGVAMQPRQALKFDALIWCPESNYFLLDETAKVDKLKLYTQLLFGTDSTLTGHWDIWQHIKLAHKTGLLNNQELYRALIRNAAEAWGLNSGELLPNKDADIVVAKMNDDTAPDNTFFNLTPADILLVTHKGQVRVADESIYLQIKDKLTAGYSKVKIGDSYKYVQGDVGGLITAIQTYWPQVSFPISVQAHE